MGGDVELNHIVSKLRASTVIDIPHGRVASRRNSFYDGSFSERENLEELNDASSIEEDREGNLPDPQKVGDIQVKDQEQVTEVEVKGLPDLRTAVDVVRSPNGVWNWLLVV